MHIEMPCNGASLGKLTKRLVDRASEKHRSSYLDPKGGLNSGKYV
jgi:hypothetical protein